MPDFEMLHKHWDGYTGGAGKDVLDLILYTEALVAAAMKLSDWQFHEGGSDLEWRLVSSGYNHELRVVLGLPDSPGALLGPKHE
jgi:hypothetical protein